MEERPRKGFLTTTREITEILKNILIIIGVLILIFGGLSLASTVSSGGGMMPLMMGSGTSMDSFENMDPQEMERLAEQFGMTEELEKFRDER